MPASAHVIEEFKKAFSEQDAALCRQLFDRYPDLKTRINEPVGPFDSPLITNIRSREMLDLFLDAGADINARSRWWAGGFGLLDSAQPALAAYAIARGALPDVHSAARLGMIDELREFLSRDPQLVNARGGDGQTPLHFASTVQIAEFLIDHGAEIDVLDVDHESTPAQYMVRDRQEIVRFLVKRGCKTDLLMATAIGDANLVGQHLDRDPGCVRMRVNEEFFPKANPHSGGTIYQWSLGWHVSAHDVAKAFGHEQIFALLMERSPSEIKLLAACWSGDEAALRALLSSEPALAAKLSESGARHVADAARNNNLPAVRLMLSTGLPVNARGQHGATPLHWAAFHGNAEMIQEILRHQPALELNDRDFNATPLGWAIYGSKNGWHCKSGYYPASVEALLKAGAKLPSDAKGAEAVQAVVEKYRSVGGLSQ